MTHSSDFKKSQVVSLPNIEPKDETRSHFKEEILPLDEDENRKKRKKRNRDNSDLKNLPSTNTI